MLQSVEVIVDPDDASPDIAAQRCIAAVSAGSKMIFVGGSSGTDEDNVHPTVVAIQEALELCKWNASQDAGLTETDLMTSNTKKEIIETETKKISLLIFKPDSFSKIGPHNSSVAPGKTVDS